MKRLPTIWLDMDGTIANLYSVENWLELGLTEKTNAYRQAELMLFDEDIIWLQKYIQNGGSVGIISWTWRDGSKQFRSATNSAKRYWLKKNLPLPYATINIVKWGTRKSKFRREGDILVDDEINNINEWTSDSKSPAFFPSNFIEQIKNYFEANNIQYKGE